MSLVQAARHFEKCDAYFDGVKHSNIERFNLIMSFNDNIIASCYKYFDWIHNLFYEASLIEITFTRKELEDIMSLLGFKSTHRASEFTTFIHSSIDEDNFLSIPYLNVVKVCKFVILCNEMGYSNLEIDLRTIQLKEWR